MKSVTVGARISPKLDAGLQRLALLTGRPKSWLLCEAIQTYVAGEEEFITAVKEGLADMRAGRVSSTNRSSAISRNDSRDVEAMSVRWTRTSLMDLDSIHQAIAQNRPGAAERVVLALLSSGEGLMRHPHQGRPGRLHQTRELVTPRLPYVIVYALSPSLVDVEPEVTILRVIHGAMQWPSKE